jgi:3-oxoacyl-[acyl-carrier protein] reductase
VTKRAAVITGGAKGIGRAIGLELARDGWSVAFCYRTTADAASETEASIRKTAGEAYACRRDVSDPVACESCVGQVQRKWGRVDALINCAGPYRRVAMLDESVGGWRVMFGATSIRFST